MKIVPFVISNQPRNSGPKDSNLASTNGGINFREINASMPTELSIRTNRSVF